MSTERTTEALTQRQMEFRLGKNDFGYVYEQGAVDKIPKLNEALLRAGGKPALCALDDYSKGGKGKAQPEFIITFADDQNTVIVLECKRSTKSHESLQHNQPRKYSVDGVLYYAKFLKDEYNVIAIAVSGIESTKLQVSTYYWAQNSEEPIELRRGRDVLYPIQQYKKMIAGEKLARTYSLDEIRQTALEMHDALRENGVSQKDKPIFLAGLLIALSDDVFAKEYFLKTSPKSVIDSAAHAIKEVLECSDIERSRIESIRNKFLATIKNNVRLRSVPLGSKNSITWFIEQLDNKIKPMMENSEDTIDALGEFYHEFVKYGSSDGKILGQVLTPHHLTEFMVELAAVGKNDTVVDICCGSGAFLVTSMVQMFHDNATQDEIERIKEQGLYGVEIDNDLYILAVANMIVRQDGKSNLINDDCFNEQVQKKLKAKNLTVGLMNPPYSQEESSELAFVEYLLDLLSPRGRGVVVVPMSCAVGTKFKDERRRLLSKHTLRAVFSMPDDMFYSKGASTNVCVMVWDAHHSHNSNEETFFGYYKDDGYVKRKKLGRVDALNRWKDIKIQWLRLYKNRDIQDGLTARRAVTADDEWLAEAYLQTDYSVLTEGIFQSTVNDYMAGLVKMGKNDSNHANSVDALRWETYVLSDLFLVERGKRLVKADREPGSIPFVTAGFENQGIAEMVGNADVKLYENVITIDMFGNAFFRPYVFSCDDNILVLKSDESIDRRALLFLVTVINQDRYRYGYGRQYRMKNFEDHKVKLPKGVAGNPDWSAMEAYVRSLTYGDEI